MGTSTKRRSATTASNGNGRRAPRTTSQQLESRQPIAGAGQEPTPQIIEVTPELAEDWLGRNTHNRPLRQTKVTMLQGIIERGEWVLNGDAIRFGKDGTLLDGQHRLWAIFLSGQTVTTLVITGLENYSQETMDRGTPRNLKDILALRDVKDASRVSSILNYKFRYDAGQVRNASVKPTPAQAIELLEASPGLDEAGRMAERVSRRFRASTGMLGTCLYELQSIDTDDCDIFVEKLLAGAGLEEGDPILALRRYLEVRASSTGGAKSEALMTHALFIKAWNAWRDGRHIDRVSWKASGLNAEAFPEPH